MVVRNEDGMEKQIVWIGVAGAAAGGLTLLISGAKGVPTIVAAGYQFIGAPFAVLITAALVAQDSSSTWSFINILRYCSAALVLAIGPPKQHPKNRLNPADAYPNP